MSKEYRLKNQQIKPLGQGLGGQLSNLGNALTAWDLGPRAKNESLRQAQRKVFLNLQPGGEIEAFQQRFTITKMTADGQDCEMLLTAAPGPESGDSESDSNAQQPASQGAEEAAPEVDSDPADNHSSTADPVDNDSSTADPVDNDSSTAETAASGEELAADSDPEAQ